MAKFKMRRKEEHTQEARCQLESSESRTLSGVDVKPFHSPSESLPVKEAPGEFPYTRGIYGEMYRKRLWTMREYLGFGTSEETNRRLRFMLEQGQTGLSLAFDLPTQLGLDSDSPRALGEIGRVGVAVSMIDDMRKVFRGIDLGKVSTSMTINATAPILFSMYVAIAEESGIPRGEIRGTVQNDILKEYLARNTYIYPPGRSLSLAMDLVEYSVKNYPKWHPISISGYHIREAGSTAVQELAFTFADAITYTEAAVERGLEVDAFAPHFSFFACNNDFMEEVAKFRAARRMWAKIMKERFGAKNEESMKLRFHTQTAGETLTALDPENNVVRVAIQALAAVLGGTQSLHTNSRDEALSLPTEESAKLALRTQQLIAYESGVTLTADPLGGSYYLEYLTDKLEKLAFEEMKKIDKVGGMLKAIESGYVKREILNAAYDKQMQIEEKKRIVVGVNAFKPTKAVSHKVHSLPESIQKVRAHQLRRTKSSRELESIRDCLEHIKSAAQNGENLLPSITESVGAGCSVGEISDALREVYGAYRAPMPF